MDKWEYLICNAFIPTDVFSNLPVEQFANAFPSQKVTSRHKGVVTIEWKGKSGEEWAFIIAVLDYLGSQGWEAYHIDAGRYNFKRKVSV